MVLVQTWPFFQLFFLGNIGKENVFHDILERKNSFLRYKNKKFKNSKVSHFSEGVNSWFWSKNGHFSKFFLFSQYRPGKCLLRYLTTKKTPFQTIKTKISKIKKIDIFPNRRTHGFGRKMAIFYTFFLGNIGKGNVFYDILERKNSFLGQKNKKLKQSKK